MTNVRVVSVAVVTSIHLDFDLRIWKHARSLASCGIETYLICPWHSAKPKLLPNLTIRVFPRVANRLLRPVLIPLLIFWHLLPLLCRIQVVHFHDFDLLPWMGLLSFFKPVVYDVHENYAEEMLVRDWIPGLLRRPLMWIVRVWHKVFPRLIRNLVLVVPQQEREFYDKSLNKIIIRNYASLQLLQEFRSDYCSRPNRLIFTGSHYLENGSMLLLEIAYRMKLRGLSAEIWVTDRFASSQFQAEFLRAISNRGIDNIRVLPYVPSVNIMKILNQGTIGIAPNLRVRKQELAIPTKLFEYMAAALPIVTSDLPFQRELIKRHNVGLLASPENPDSFVSAIEQLVNDRSLAESFGRNGQLAFKQYYTWESQIPALLAFYQTSLR